MKGSVVVSLYFFAVVTRSQTRAKKAVGAKLDACYKGMNGTRPVAV